MGMLQRMREWDPFVIKRETPEERPSSLLLNTVPDWWAQNVSGQATLYGNALLADRVWVANRCQQLNSQQIASMPLVWHGPDGVDEPAWVSSPDPNLFPNGIGDAIHAAVSLMYGWGFVCLYVTSTYADGFPRTWTVLDSARVNIRWDESGGRAYKIGEQPLDPRRVIQVDRNPGTGLHGTSALRAYAQAAYGLLAAGNQAMVVNQGGIPGVYLKPQKKQTAEQAALLQSDWMAASQRRNGAPPVVPNDIDVMSLEINPSDLALLDTQEFNAKAIMTAYGVPAPMMNMALQGGLTYQNPAALGEMWWRFELRTTATRFGNALSAQALPRGQWVSFDAADTFAPIDSMSDDDDEQASQVAKASPAQQPRPLTAIGGTG